MSITKLEFGILAFLLDYADDEQVPKAVPLSQDCPKWAGLSGSNHTSQAEEKLGLR
jgi:hypothetical protein